MIFKLKRFFILVFFAQFLFSMNTYAKKKHPTKFLSLYVGIYNDVIMNIPPQEISKGGNWKGLVKLQYNKSKQLLRVYPKKTGVGTVVLKNKNSGKILYELRFDIKKTNLVKVLREIRNLLADIEGISFKVLNNKVIVDGQILLPRDMSRIHSVVKQYGAQASSLVTLSPLAQKKIAQLIERDVNNPEVHVRAVNGKFILEGVVDNQKQKDQAEIIAKAYVPDVVVDEAVADKKVLERKSDIVINLINIRAAAPEGPKKTVQLVVHYVELKKDYSKGFRFQWTPGLSDGTGVSFSSGGNNAGGVVASLTGTISNLIPKLNWAKEHGHARVLQSTSIIAEDGSKGLINSITRNPYQVVTKEGLPSTSFEETGIKASITPQVLGARSDSIKLKLHFSVKALVGITSAGPLTSQREIQTVIVVKSGQSAAVGGLVSNESSTDYNKLPANSSANPILSFYASKSHAKSQSQFVVFVTPRIKSSASSGSGKIKRKFRLKY
ncbi:MAG: pilus assembly protein [Bdellovibrionaceae bacterium]|jgi:pilus assembly protein CpaC|nr:pilus assembly protein [Pseudobdellovibrionaceae bacterium]